MSDGTVTLRLQLDREQFDRDLLELEQREVGLQVGFQLETNQLVNALAEIQPLTVTIRPVLDNNSVTALRQDISAIYSQSALQLKVAPAVDHLPLEKLNEHLEIKRKHVDEINQYFRNNPVRPQIDTTALDGVKKSVQTVRQSIQELGKSFREATRTTADAVKGLNQQLTETTEKYKALTAPTSQTTDQKIDIQQKQTVEHQFQKLKLDDTSTGGFIEKQSQAIIDAIKMAMPRSSGLLSFLTSPFRGVLRGFYEGTGMTYAGKLTQGTINRVEQQLGLTLDRLGEKSGEIIGRFINQGVDKGIKAIGIQGGLSAVVSDLKVLLEEIDEAAINLHVDQKFNDFSNSVSRFLKNLVKAKLEFQDLLDLVKATAGVISTPVDILTERRVVRTKKEAQQIAEYVRQNPEPVDLSNASKGVILTVGGFAGAGGKSSNRIGTTVARAVGEGYKVVSVPNYGTDLETPATVNPARWVLEAIGRVGQNNLLRTNPDVLNTLYQVLQIKQQNPELPVTLVGHSAGGFVVEEVQRLLNEMGIQGVKSAAFGTPRFREDKPENFEHVVGDRDVILRLTQLVGAKKPLISSSTPSHSFEEIIASPEGKEALAKTLGISEGELLNFKRAKPLDKPLTDAEDRIMELMESVGKVMRRVAYHFGDAVVEGLEADTDKIKVILGDAFNLEEFQKEINEAGDDLEKLKAVLLPIMEKVEQGFKKGEKTGFFEDPTNQLKVAAPLVKMLEPAVTKYRQMALKERAAPLAMQRAREILATEQEALTEEEIAARVAKAKKAEASGKKVKGVPAADLIMGSVTNVNAPQVVSDQTKELVITVGGYGGVEGRSSHRIAGRLLRSEIERLEEQKKKTEKGIPDPWGDEEEDPALRRAFISVANVDTDIRRGVDRRRGILESLAKTNARGFSKDAVEIAAQAIAAKQKNPEITIKILGESGGGFVAHEAALILKELGIDAEYLSVGTPEMRWELPAAQGKKIISTDEELGRDVVGLAKLGLATVPEPEILGVQGHPYEHYMNAQVAELMYFLEGSAKDRITKQGAQDILAQFKKLDFSRFSPRQLEDLASNAYKNLQNVRRQIIDATEEELTFLRPLEQLFEDIYVRYTPESKPLQTTRAYIEQAKKVMQDLKGQSADTIAYTIETLASELEQIRKEFENLDEVKNASGTTGRKVEQIRQELASTIQNVSRPIDEILQELGQPLIEVANYRDFNLMKPTPKEGEEEKEQKEDFLEFLREEIAAIGETPEPSTEALSDLNYLQSIDANLAAVLQILQQGVFLDKGISTPEPQPVEQVEKKALDAEELASMPVIPVQKETGAEAVPETTLMTAALGNVFTPEVRSTISKAGDFASEVVGKAVVLPVAMGIKAAHEVYKKAEEVESKVLSILPAPVQGVVKGVKWVNSNVVLPAAAIGTLREAGGIAGLLAEGMDDVARTVGHVAGDLAASGVEHQISGVLAHGAEGGIQRMIEGAVTDVVTDAVEVVARTTAESATTKAALRAEEAAAGSAAVKAAGGAAGAIVRRGELERQKLESLRQQYQTMSYGELYEGETIDLDQLKASGAQLVLSDKAVGMLEEITALSLRQRSAKPKLFTQDVIQRMLNAKHDIEAALSGEVAQVENTESVNELLNLLVGKKDAMGRRKGGFFSPEEAKEFYHALTGLSAAKITKTNLEKQLEQFAFPLEALKSKAAEVLSQRLQGKQSVAPETIEYLKTKVKEFQSHFKSSMQTLIKHEGKSLNDPAVVDTISAAAKVYFEIREFIYQHHSHLTKKQREELEKLRKSLQGTIEWEGGPKVGVAIRRTVDAAIHQKYSGESLFSSGVEQSRVKAMEAQALMRIIANSVREPAETFEELKDIEFPAFETIQEQIEAIKEMATYLVEKLPKAEKLDIVNDKELTDLQTVIALIAKIRETYYQSLKSAKVNFSEDLKDDAIREEYTAALQTLNTIQVAALQKLGDYSESVIEAQKAGNAVAQGFLQGLQSFEAEQEGGEIGNNLIKALKDVLGIKSPSRVMITIGEMITQGLEIGLQGIKEVADNATSMFMSPIQRIMEWMRQAGVETGENFQEGLNTGIQSIQEVVKTAQQQVEVAQQLPSMLILPNQPLQEAKKLILPGEVQASEGKELILPSQQPKELKELILPPRKVKPEPSPILLPNQNVEPQKELVLPNQGGEEIKNLVLPNAPPLEIQELIIPGRQPIEVKELLLPDQPPGEIKELILPKEGVQNFQELILPQEIKDGIKKTVQEVAEEVKKIILPGEATQRVQPLLNQFGQIMGATPEIILPTEQEVKEINDASLSQRQYQQQQIEREIYRSIEAENRWRETARQRSKLTVEDLRKERKELQELRKEKKEQQGLMSELVKGMFSENGFKGLKSAKELMLQITEKLRESGPLGVFLVNAMTNLRNALVGIFVGYNMQYAFEKFIGYLQKAYQTAVEFNRLEIGLKFALKGSSAQGMQFVESLSQRLGTPFLESARAYQSIAAATRGGVLEGEATEEVFTAVSEAAAILGLSGPDTSLALTAVQQIISKGRVSAEELRQQLAERLPGAFQIAARAMGTTEQGLNQMLERGELLSSVFIPRFARQLRMEMAGSLDDAANSTQGVINRFENARIALEKSFGEGVTPITNTGLKVLTAILEQINNNLSLVVSLIGGAIVASLQYVWSIAAPILGNLLKMFVGLTNAVISWRSALQSIAVAAGKVALVMALIQGVGSAVNTLQTMGGNEATVALRKNNERLRKQLEEERNERLGNQPWLLKGMAGFGGFLVGSIAGQRAADKFESSVNLFSFAVDKLLKFISAPERGELARQGALEAGQALLSFDIKGLMQGIGKMTAAANPLRNPKSRFGDDNSIVGLMGRIEQMTGNIPVLNALTRGITFNPVNIAFGGVVDTLTGRAPTKEQMDARAEAIELGNMEDLLAQPFSDVINIINKARTGAKLTQEEQDLTRQRAGMLMSTAERLEAAASQARDAGRVEEADLYDKQAATLRKVAEEALKSVDALQKFVDKLQELQLELRKMENEELGRQVELTTALNEGRISERDFNNAMIASQEELLTGRIAKNQAYLKSLQEFMNSEEFEKMQQSEKDRLIQQALDTEKQILQDQLQLQQLKNQRIEQEIQLLDKQAGYYRNEVELRKSLLRLEAERQRFAGNLTPEEYEQKIAEAEIDAIDNQIKGLKTQKEELQKLLRETRNPILVDRIKDQLVQLDTQLANAEIQKLTTQMEAQNKILDARVNIRRQELELLNRQLETSNRLTESMQGYLSNVKEALGSLRQMATTGLEGILEANRTGNPNVRMGEREQRLRDRLLNQRIAAANARQLGLIGRNSLDAAINGMPLITLYKAIFEQERRNFAEKRRLLEIEQQLQRQILELQLKRSRLELEQQRLEQQQRYEQAVIQGDTIGAEYAQKQLALLEELILVTEQSGQLQQLGQSLQEQAQRRQLERERLDQFIQTSREVAQDPNLRPRTVQYLFERYRYRPEEPMARGETLPLTRAGVEMNRQTDNQLNMVTQVLAANADRLAQLQQRIEQFVQVNATPIVQPQPQTKVDNITITLNNTFQNTQQGVAQVERQLTDALDRVLKGAAARL